jgi:hypothetical protein
MELTTDGDYTERQQALVEHILSAIKLELEQVETPSELVQQLTGSIAFAVTGLIDGTSSAEYNGSELDPHLTFPIGTERLLYAGGNSWMHEYVYRILPTLFPAA